MKELSDFLEGIPLKIVQADHGSIPLRQLHDRPEQLPVLGLCQQDRLLSAAKRQGTVPLDEAVCKASKNEGGCADETGDCTGAV